MVLRVVGMVVWACCTISGRAVLSMALAKGLSLSSTSVPSHASAPIARRVSGVWKRGNLGVCDRKIVYVNSSVPY